MAATGIEPARVVALTLTYGDRTQMLAEMARGVAAEGVKRVLVLGNGLTAQVGAATQALATDLAQEGIQLDLHPLPQNGGSAPGYGKLLEIAAADPALQAVWFLDDDNVPEPGCLTALLQAQEQTEGAVTALRRDRAYMLEAVATGEARPPASGEAFGKDVRRLPGRILRKLGRAAKPKTTSKTSSAGAITGPVAVPRVPYGGLLVPATLVRQVAPPRADFALYADDYEYTARLAAAAGLHAVPGAFITDLEQSWNASGAAVSVKSQAARLATMTPDFRMFYALRNALYLDRQRVLARTWPWFVLNLIWLVGGIGGRAALKGRWGNLRCLLDAVRAGLNGQLGVAARYPLP